MINLHERMLLTSAGVDPATSWSPVGRRIQLSHWGRPPCVLKWSNNLPFLIKLTEAILLISDWLYILTDIYFKFSTMGTHLILLITCLHPEFTPDSQAYSRLLYSLLVSISLKFSGTYMKPTMKTNMADTDDKKKSWLSYVRNFDYILTDVAEDRCVIFVLIDLSAYIN